MEFDIKRFMGKRSESIEYQRQLERLKNASKHTGCIEDAIDGAVQNLRQKKHSFVIYGEPQSGKTEMMICLTAKLIDEGYPFVLHLLNDSVDLLNQNLGRFSGSGLAPAAKHFTDILDPSVQIKGHQHVVFCKKNGNDLRKLVEKISQVRNLVIIDDEADYASPNAKVNKGTRTPINDLMTELLANDGIYIGVTATPARLDLNNTFDNDSSQWVTFPPHPAYTGQDIFFPLSKKVDQYSLQLIPDQGAGPEHARRALFGFLVNVAYLNKYANDREQNYSFLIHTSGKKVDHKADREHIYRCLRELVERQSESFKKYAEAIWRLAHERYPAADPNRLTEYVLDNIARQKIVTLNSERDWKDNSAAATSPSALFTIIIGGNIVSRGVTFDNLLSMFFTRDVKHKIQQDTYIQRARMFGSRGGYLRYFELTIPKSLYGDWHRCFVFHRLALAAITEGLGSLVWLGDKRIAAVASSSIDRATVDLNRGEMAFSKFDWNNDLDKVAADSASAEAKIKELARLAGEKAFPIYVRRFIQATSPNGDASVAIHPASLISNTGDYDADKIARTKGLMGKTQLQPEKYPDAIHHLKIFRNAQGKARLYYKLSGSIQMIRNTANDP